MFFFFKKKKNKIIVQQRNRHLISPAGCLELVLKYLLTLSLHVSKNAASTKGENLNL